MGKTNKGKCLDAVLKTLERRHNGETNQRVEAHRTGLQDRRSTRRPGARSSSHFLTINKTRCIRMRF
jgi:hypothetical protein